MFRRLLQLRQLGIDVTLVPAEPLPEGGAPRTLVSAGVDLDANWREPLPQRLARSAGDGTLLVVTAPLLMPRSHREAIIAWPGPVVLEVDHLPSQELLRSRGIMGPGEQPGIDTEIDHLTRLENELCGRAQQVWVPHADVSRTLDSAAVVLPPAPLVAAAGAPEPAQRHIVMPARFGEEWATPDERLPDRVLARGWDPARPDLVLVPEDTEARLRSTVRRHRPGPVSMCALADSVRTAGAAVLALDLRTHGVPTHARRFELSCAGVPWIASTQALGVDSPEDATGLLGALAGEFVVDDVEGQCNAIDRLLDDAELRREVAELQQAHMRSSWSSSLSEMESLLEGLGIDPGVPATGTAANHPPRSAYSTEYDRVPRQGTLAAADERIAAIEAEMVPLRLLDRDTSIDLQSTLEPDARYRVLERTHLDARATSGPSRTDRSREIDFSVLVPTHDSDPRLLDECIGSVVEQMHPNWELCIVDDGSRRTAHHEVLEGWAARDERIKVRINPWNQGIGLASNDALCMATGRWTVLLDHDDVLKPDALAWCARYISACTDYDLWYSDEDKILPDGRLGMPFFKPDWSPDLERGVNYVCHLLCVRTEVLRAVGGFRAGYDGAQDYDLVLRLTEEIAARGTRVGHIAKPLYSWRMVPGSTALATGEKPAAHHAGHRALSDSVVRSGEPAWVQDGEHDTTHRVRYAHDPSWLVTIMIPTRDRVDLLARCVERVEATAGDIPYEFLIVDNDSQDPDTLEYLDELASRGHQVVRYPHEFSFARQMNLGCLHARGELLLLLNNDIWAQSEEWLARMCEHAQRPEVGLVGSRLVFPPGVRGGGPQHEGIVMGMAGLAYNIDLGAYMGMNQFVRNTSGVTAACAMLRTSVFLGVGGMEERLRVAYNDVDFGLRVGEYGYRVLYTPDAQLEHPESASRGDLHPGEDEDWLVDRWGGMGEVRDPFINPHLEWLAPVFYRL